MLPPPVSMKRSTAANGLTRVLLRGSAAEGKRFIVNTKHDFRASSSANIHAASSQETVCIFCHTPHNAAPLSPLWNKEIEPQKSDDLRPFEETSNADLIAQVLDIGQKDIYTDAPEYAERVEELGFLLEELSLRKF